MYDLLMGSAGSHGLLQRQGAAKLSTGSRSPDRMATSPSPLAPRLDAEVFSLSTYQLGDSTRVVGGSWCGQRELDGDGPD